jgi:regulator of sigma E protease
MTPLTIIAAIVLIGVLITIHEFGHFIVAKLCGVKVEVFSIGFGRPIVEINKGETNYRIAWIPFGGYVRMLGQDPDDEVAPEDVGRSLPEQSALARIAIFFAGPAMNLLLPFLIVLPMVGFGDQYQEVHSSQIGATDHSMPGYLAGLRKGDVITSINGEPVHAFWQVIEHINRYAPDHAALTIVVDRAGVSKTLKVRPKAVHYSDPFLGHTKTTYVIGYQPDMLNPLIAIPDPQSLAASAGLRTFDKVISIGGVDTTRFVDVVDRLRAVAPNSSTSIVVERIGDPVLPPLEFLREKTTIELKYTRGDGGSDPGLRHAGTCVTSVDPNGAASQLLKAGDCLISVDGFTQTLGAFLDRRLNTHPDRAKKLEWIRNGRLMSGSLQRRKVTLSDPMAGEFTVWSLGFSRPRYEMIANEKVKNEQRFAHAWYEARSRFTRQTEQILRAIGGMFTGAVSPTQLSGPLTIFQLAGRAAREGLDVYLNLMVLLSLSIGFFNLLPIPLLDGGHILVAFIELITRRAPSAAVLEALQRAGVLLILSLFVFAMINDSVRTWRTVKPDDDVSIDRLKGVMMSVYRNDVPGQLAQVTPETRAELAKRLGLPKATTSEEFAQRLTVFLGWRFELRSTNPPEIVEGAQDQNKRVIKADIGGRATLVPVHNVKGRWLVDLTNVRLTGSPSL